MIYQLFSDLEVDDITFSPLDSSPSPSSIPAEEYHFRTDPFTVLTPEYQCSSQEMPETKSKKEIQIDTFLNTLKTELMSFPEEILDSDLLESSATSILMSRPGNLFSFSLPTPPPPQPVEPPPTPKRKYTRRCKGEGGKPFKCNVCSKSFTSHFSLKRHYKVHTNGNDFLFCFLLSWLFRTSQDSLLYSQLQPNVSRIECFE